MNRLVEAEVIAAFDFDGTISRRDTLIPFLRQFCGTPRTMTALFAALLRLPFFVLGAIDRRALKEVILMHCLKGVSRELLEESGRAFAAATLDTLIYPQALERLHWHRAAGHGCVLVSANLSVYLTPWAEKMGFDNALCSELAVDEEGCYTGRLAGLNCWGEEKVCRLFSLLRRPRNSYTLYCYGDSRGDRELLAAADYAYYGVMPPPPRSRNRAVKIDGDLRR